VTGEAADSNRSSRQSGVLPGGQDARERVGVAAAGVIDLRGADVVDGQDEVVPAELAFPVQELLRLGPAMGAAEEAGGDDDQQ
jgi:hypothetical protein